MTAGTWGREGGGGEGRGGGGGVSCSFNSNSKGAYASRTSQNDGVRIIFFITCHVPNSGKIE